MIHRSSERLTLLSFIILYCWVTHPILSMKVALTNSTYWTMEEDGRWRRRLTIDDKGRQGARLRGVKSREFADVERFILSQKPKNERSLKKQKTILNFLEWLDWPIDNMVIFKKLEVSNLKKPVMNHGEHHKTETITWKIIVILLPYTRDIAIT